MRLQMHETPKELANVGIGTGVYKSAAVVNARRGGPTSLSEPISLQPTAATCLYARSYLPLGKRIPVYLCGHNG